MFTLPGVAFGGIREPFPKGSLDSPKRFIVRFAQSCADTKRDTKYQKKEIGEIDNDLKGENGTTAKIYIVGDYAEGAPKSFGDS